MSSMSDLDELLAVVGAVRERFGMRRMHFIAPSGESCILAFPDPPPSVPTADTRCPVSPGARAVGAEVPSQTSLELPRC